MKTSKTHDFEFKNLQNTPPLLGFKEDCDFSSYKKEVKEKLTRLLCLPLTECDNEFKTEYEKQEDGYKNIRFTVQTEPGYLVPCHLLIPNVKKDKYPLTLCLSGHYGGMHINMGIIKNETDKRDLENCPHLAAGLRNVKEGRAALIIEARNFGESSLSGHGNSCTEAAKIAIIMGRTTVGERVWDAMHVLTAVLDKFTMLDKEDILCSGHSGGGTATWYLSCMDERIKTVAPSCAICFYEDSIAAMHHCMCNHIPSIRKYFEISDLACLIAPRKLVIAAGDEDDIFPFEATKRTFEKVKAIYKAAGAENNCKFVVGHGGHNFYADEIWQELKNFGL